MKVSFHSCQEGFKPNQVLLPQTSSAQCMISFQSLLHPTRPERGTTVFPRLWVRITCSSWPGTLCSLSSDVPCFLIVAISLSGLLEVASGEADVEEHVRAQSAHRCRPTRQGMSANCPAMPSKSHLYLQVLKSPDRRIGNRCGPQHARPASLY